MRGKGLSILSMQSMLFLVGVVFLAVAPVSQAQAIEYWADTGCNATSESDGVGWWYVAKYDTASWFSTWPLAGSMKWQNNVLELSPAGPKRQTYALCGLPQTLCPANSNPYASAPQMGAVTHACDVLVRPEEDCLPGSTIFYCPGSTVYETVMGLGGDRGPRRSPPDGSCPIADPVDPFNGMFIYSEEDLGYPSPSMVRMIRYYSSGDPSIGSFGKGTSSNYNRQLLGSGEYIKYVTPDGGSYIFVQQTDGSYLNKKYPFLKQATAHLNPDGTRELVFAGGMTYTFDANGMLIEEKDPNGNFVTVTRDSNGSITGISDSFGRNLAITTTTMTVGGVIHTLIASVSDALGNTVSYTYDNEAKLTSVSLPDGGTKSYAYDTNGRVSSVTNPRGTVEVANTYDSNGRVVSQTHADGGVFDLGYVASGGIVSETSVTEPDGGTTIYRFNGYGYITEIVDAYGHSTIHERAAGTNRLLSVTDPLLRTTSYTYDANGNVASVTDPANNTTSYVYDFALNKPTQITDALGNITTMAYDASGNLLQIDPPGDPLTTITYNASGLPVTVTDALNDRTSFGYDAHGMISNTVDPLGNEATFAYDAAGRLTTTMDPEGRSTHYTYDTMGRVTGITDALNGATAFSYDENGNLLSVTDAKGQTVGYSYDARDRVSSMTDQLGNSETYGYDQNDNLTSVTDRKGQTTAYTYDLMGRVTGANYADGSHTAYTYDEVGRLTTINDSVSGQIGYTYTNTGCSAGCSGGFEDKVAQETTPLGTVGYEYDALGRRTSMTVAGQTTVTYSYDANSHLTGIARGALSFGLLYDAAGRRTKLTLPSGAYADYVYDPASRLTNLIHKASGGSVIDSFAYTYDGAGNRLTRQTPSESISYQYDDLYRLLRADYSVTETYSYDHVGNRLSSHISSTYAYNAANRLLTDDTYTYEYDANGNLASKAIRNKATTYTYDARNRLVKVTEPDGKTFYEFKYDALGRRIEKAVTVKVGKDLITTRYQYLYDSLDIVQESKDGAVEANYVRTLNIDEPLARIEADGTVRYYHADALGSVTALTDSSGAVQTRYRYESFGKTEMTLDDSHGVANPFRYTSRELDETGDYYYRARYYDTEVGRFISEDPIRFLGGADWYVYVDSVGKPPFETNLYSYAFNNPINYIDPLGLYGTKDCSYYQQACKTNGGFYECQIVERACNFFPKSNETSDCIRQCLQERHKVRQPEGVCSEEGQTGWSEFASEHEACIAGCFRNPENPYDANGPDLPDEDIRLY
jgi:RHS repeat-associated protein